MIHIENDHDNSGNLGNNHEHRVEIKSRGVNQRSASRDK
jgi:hypothetical protein